MRLPVRTKSRITAIKRPGVIKGLAVLFLLCVLIKAAASIGGAALDGGLAARLIQSEGTAAGILGFELGSSGGGTRQELTTLLFGSTGELQAGSGDGAENTVTGGNDVQPEAEPEQMTVPETEQDHARGGLFYGAEAQKTDSFDTGAAADALPDRSSEGIVLDNTTGYEIDVQSLLDRQPDIKLTDGGPAVLIIHTHTSEAYTRSGDDTYEESDPFRTEDKSKNIVRIGDELASTLEARGISVIHDRRSYDYPSYTGCYNRTYSSVEAYLKQYPSIKLVLDIHRDSITASDGTQYKTIAQIGDETCSQIMFVVGSDDAGLEHPGWRENLSLALSLQSEMNDAYPTLARPVRISRYRYNQQITPGSLIVEVGCAGNTLEESLTAIRYFADAAANVFEKFYK